MAVAGALLAMATAIGPLPMYRKGKTMSKRTVEIEARLYQRAAARAAQEGKTLSEIIEIYLTSWVGPETIVRTRYESYVVRPGDTLAKIALKMYGDAKKYTLIAEHNHITDPGMIRVNQVLRIPFAEEVPVDELEGDTQVLGKRFRFPLDETETNYYKFGTLYASNSRWAGKPHPGVDFHQAKGADVYAAGEGTVLVNQQDPTGYGHYIMIEHTLTTGAKVYSLYGHLQYDDESFVSPPVGTQIQGENVVIGKEGETGYAGVPHVHFEIKKTDQLGLYSMITVYNLRDYFYDPYEFIRDPNNRYVPV
jgi:LysM repeat protein